MRLLGSRLGALGVALALMACGGSDKVTSQARSILDQGSRIRVQPGTAKGATYTGSFRLGYSALDLKCRASGGSSAFQFSDSDEEISCEQNDGAITCSNPDGDSLAGHVDEDGSFALTGSHHFEGTLEGTGARLPASLNLVGQFTSPDSGSGSVQATARGSAEGRNNTCVVSGSFSLSREENEEDGKSKSELLLSELLPGGSTFRRFPATASRGHAGELTFRASAGGDRVSVTLGSGGTAELTRRVGGSSEAQLCDYQVLRSARERVTLSLECDTVTGSLNLPSSDF